VAGFFYVENMVVSHNKEVYTLVIMMEQKNQESEPVLVSLVEKQKEAASEFVLTRIEEIQNEKNMSALAAVREVYEEVKGQKYREEQAVAKLLEYLNVRNEADLRKEEIKEVYPKFNTIVDSHSGDPSANDEKYLVAAA